MKVKGKHYHTIWLDPVDKSIVHCIDQRRLPFEFVVEQFTQVEQVIEAIRDMHLRGAPLIGVAAAFGLYLAALEYKQKSNLQQALLSAANRLEATRPTAVNLKMAIERQISLIEGVNDSETIITSLLKGAQDLLEEELENCRLIGQYGLELIEQICQQKGCDEINVLTHCNAGWLACVDYGTATAPIYFAHEKGIKIHVWVDETRPRNQGARLTAWELGQHGVKHTLITDNTGGHLMQHGLVDMVIVGSDRTTRTGDVANKIGTYLKALAARDNNIPFYVALPSTSIDFSIRGGLDQIPIEERNSDEIHRVEGFVEGVISEVRISPAESPALNIGFDVTPARLVTSLITERGICLADQESIKQLFPDKF